MRQTITAVLFALTFAFPGCWGESAEQILQTAEFEELQRNEEHARQLYQRLVDNFPDSPEAKAAAQRLAELDTATDH